MNWYIQNHLTIKNRGYSMASPWKGATVFLNKIKSFKLQINFFWCQKSIYMPNRIEMVKTNVFHSSATLFTRHFGSNIECINVIIFNIYLFSSLRLISTWWHWFSSPYLTTSNIAMLISLSTLTIAYRTPYLLLIFWYLSSIVRNK